MEVSFIVSNGAMIREFAYAQCVARVEVGCAEQTGSCSGEYLDWWSPRDGQPQRGCDRHCVCPVPVNEPTGILERLRHGPQQRDAPCSFPSVETKSSPEIDDRLKSLGYLK